MTKKVLPSKNQFELVAPSVKSMSALAKELGIHYATAEKYTITYQIDTTHFNSNRDFHRKYEPKVLSSRRCWQRRYNDGDLSFEDFLIKSQLNCFYCDSPPSNNYNWYRGDKRSHPDTIAAADFIYNGLDRVDSNLPHDKINVVTCCFNCNKSKSDMSFDDFKNHLSKIIVFRKNNYNDCFVPIRLPELILPKFESLRRPFQKPEIIIPGITVGKLKIISQTNPVKGRKAFLCLCECGKEKIITENSLYMGDNVSCGGPRICQWKYPPDISKARSLWNNAGYKKDGLLFEEFYALSQLNCSYCNISPSNCFNLPTLPCPEISFVYNGIDRIDSSKTHTIDNVVPACWNCNRMKSDRTLEEFDQWLNNIQTHFLNKQLSS